MKSDLTNQIPQIFTAHSLPSIQSITEINQGVVNPCYDVNNEWIVRFNTRDKSIPKFSREMKAYDLCRTKNVPVPEQTLYSHSQSGFEVLIATKVGGESLEKKWDQLSESNKHDMVKQAASWLKKIHSIELSHFGGLSEDDPKFDTWTEYLIYRATYDFEACQKDELLPGSDLNAVMTIIKDRTYLFSGIVTPKLIHGDFHFGNILMNENKITSIIDWEWAFAGDPLFDFLVRSNINGECSDGFDILTRAYGLLWPLSPEKHQVFRVYQLISAIESIWISHRYLAPLYDWGKVQLQQKLREYESLKTELLND